MYLNYLIKLFIIAIIIIIIIILILITFCCFTSQLNRDTIQFHVIIIMRRLFNLRLFSILSDESTSMIAEVLGRTYLQNVGVLGNFMRNGCLCVLVIFLGYRPMKYDALWMSQIAFFLLVR